MSIAVVVTVSTMFSLVNLRCRWYGTVVFSEWSFGGHQFGTIMLPKWPAKGCHKQRRRKGSIEPNVTEHAALLKQQTKKNTDWVSPGQKTEYCVLVQLLRLIVLCSHTQIIGASLSEPYTSMMHCTRMCVSMLVRLDWPLTGNFKWACLNFNITKIELVHSVGDEPMRSTVKDYCHNAVSA